MEGEEEERRRNGHETEVQIVRLYVLSSTSGFFFPQRYQLLILEQPAVPSQSFSWDLHLEASKKTYLARVTFLRKAAAGRIEPGAATRNRVFPSTQDASSQRNTKDLLFLQLPSPAFLNRT